MDRCALLVGGYMQNLVTLGQKIKLGRIIWVFQTLPAYYLGCSADTRQGYVVYGLTKGI